MEDCAKGQIKYISQV